MNEDRKGKGFANCKLISVVTISVLFVDIGNVQLPNSLW